MRTPSRVYLFIRYSPFIIGALALAAIPVLLLAGCSQSPLKGGRAKTEHRPGGLVQTIQQSENPSQPSAQAQETVEEKSYTVPANSVIRSGTESNRSEIVLALPMPIIERRHSSAHTELGAAQKDTTRELGAKLKSLAGVVWVGVALFIFGIGSAFYPPLKVVVGSVTTSAAISAGGLALIVLPSLIVGHELLILGAVVLAVGGWFIAHRHGKAQGQLSELLKKV